MLKRREEVVAGEIVVERDARDVVDQGVLEGQHRRLWCSNCPSSTLCQLRRLSASATSIDACAARLFATRQDGEELAVAGNHMTEVLDVRRPGYSSCRRPIRLDITSRPPTPAT